MGDENLELKYITKSENNKNIESLNSSETGPVKLNVEEPEEEAFIPVGILKSINNRSNNDNNNSSNLSKSNCKRKNSSRRQKIIKFADDDNTRRGKLIKLFKNYGGIFLTLLSSLCFSFALMIVKLLKEKGFHGFTCAFYRYQGSLLPTIPIAIYLHYGKNVKIFEAIWPINNSQKRKTFWGIMIRGIFGAFTTITRFYALHYLTLADVSSIAYSYPVIVTILAYFVLNEPLGIFSICTTLFALIGVCIISRPSILTGESEMDSKNLIGIGIAIISLFCNSIAVVLTRKLRKVNFACMNIIFGLYGSIISFILAYSLGVFRIPTEINDILLILAMAGFSFIALTLLIFAYKLENAGPVALLRCMDTIYAFILQFIFLGVVPDTFSVIGGIIILICVALTGVTKWLGSLSDENRAKKIFWLLLK